MYDNFCPNAPSVQGDLTPCGSHLDPRCIMFCAFEDGFVRASIHFAPTLYFKSQDLSFIGFYYDSLLSLDVPHFQAVPKLALIEISWHCRNICSKELKVF